MNYGFRKVIVPCSPPSISVSFFKISARAQPEARSLNIELVSLNLSPSHSSKSLRGRSPKQGLINFPSISAAKLLLFPHIAYRQILTFYLKTPIISAFFAP